MLPITIIVGFSNSNFNIVKLLKSAWNKNWPILLCYNPFAWSNPALLSLTKAKTVNWIVTIKTIKTVQAYQND